MELFRNRRSLYFERQTMSRNFELLQNLGREPKLFSSATFPAPDGIERQAPKLFANDFGVDPEINQLCQRLFVGGADGVAEIRVVAFCSVQPAVSEGEICAHTAMMLAARVNRSVCVVDSNPLSPSLHKFFGVSNQSGFSEAATERFYSRFPCPPDWRQQSHADYRRRRDA